MSIVYYNTSLNMIMYNWLCRLSVFYDDFPFDAADSFWDLVEKEQKIKKRVRGTCVIDRENTHKFQYNTLGDGGVPFEYVKSQPLEDLMFRRAEKIKETGRPVQFFWSGGVDSTAALCIMDQVLPDGQMMVQMTPTSIEENPNFYNQRVKPYDHNIYEGKNLYSVADPNRFIVVECGAADALYGSMGGAHLLGDATRVWRMRNRFGRTSRRYRFFQDYPGDTINLDNIWPFYESRGIEQWFVNSILSKTIKPFDRNDEAGYVNQKKALRDIIFKHTGDEEYAYGKTGVWSIRANEDKIEGESASATKLIKDITNAPPWLVAMDAKYKVMAITDDGKVLNRDNFREWALIPLLNTNAIPQVGEYSKNNNYKGRSEEYLR